MNEEQADRIIELLESIDDRLSNIEVSSSSVESNTSSIDSNTRSERSTEDLYTALRNIERGIGDLIDK
ncbi:hypothetical protein [Zunongwangia atlantica]|uniref:Uncharacterized protein n=1 Tax=Zunongwangia atlantica 22II14-10F7 TaxID=1185767 RepID=A0A1Y1SYF9_9FLAO|nr:hypothetical protein [Zunongwangia atlantica]ORL43789.1 hypothetical protein IIF7_19094 [Zunongwangia atlantica 22II14-10F7]